MVFYPPSWLPPLPFEPPDSITCDQFIHDERYGRTPFDVSRNSVTCGISGKTYTAKQEAERTEYLARALSKELGWLPNSGSEWDKVIGIYGLNTIDTMTVAYSVHRLNGIISTANAAYTAPELEHQMRSSGVKAIFTCVPQLDVTLQVAASLGIPAEHIYIMDLPFEITGGKKVSHKSVDDLVMIGEKLGAVEPLKWEKGQGAKQVAFLCYSSGTSGLPKGVMISHLNAIITIMGLSGNEYRHRAGKGPDGRPQMESIMVLLPLSHVYVGLPPNPAIALINISMHSAWKGDQIVVLPKFELQSFLNAISVYKITSLPLVPPIAIVMIKQQAVCAKYDLSSVEQVIIGAAPLGPETSEALTRLYPNFSIRQGYGLTESSALVCITAMHDIMFESTGSLVTGFKAKLLSPDGKEITEYNSPGELWVTSGSIVLGYHNNDKANEETFFTDENGERWLRTGDEVIFLKSPKGYDHIAITDRIKELIKVKGLQVAPAELEAHILTHPSVADVAVISVPDDEAGEVPKAYVVKSGSVGLEENDNLVARDIKKHVQEHKARHKWLKGGVEFIDVIPKSPSGKILRRMLREKEKADKKGKRAKL